MTNDEPMTNVEMSKGFELRVDEQGRLVLRREGEEEAVDVRLSRAFPLSAPGKYVSVRSSEGKELLLIEDPSKLPAAQQRVIDRWLAATTFVPQIRRVEEVDIRFGYQRWKVETDRGAVEFQVQEREDLRFLPDGRFRVKDVDGNLYELPRLEELDAASRRAVIPVI